MPRYLVQNETTGRFLVPSMLDGQPEWVSFLREAGGGVLSDFECAQSMAVEYAERGECVSVVDLDRLGTINDYE